MFYSFDFDGTNLDIYSKFDGRLKMLNVNKIERLKSAI